MSRLHNAGMQNRKKNSVTLDDLEWRNSPNQSVVSPNSVSFGRIT